ncbi:dual specificity protein phosphatase family protein [Flavobacteriales bacterium]|nr:dual specificity protein phosphatase family protein [Flavobacteriales bacterium]
MGLLTCILLFIVGFGEPEPDVVSSAKWAVKIESDNFENLFKVCDDIYRSEQPSSAAMIEAQSLGIKSVFNLRTAHGDARHLKNSKLQALEYPIHTKGICYADLVESLRVIREAKKPVLVHCWHGADRTSAIIAAYRLIEMKWTKEEAIAEIRNGGFGFHEDWFPNIIQLIEDLDVEKLKRDLNSPS